ncbi:unnamed protein product [Camellia sinensis]
MGDTTVDSLVDINGEWNLTHIYNTFPMPLISEILKIQPPRNNGGRDKPRWRKSPDGDFSTSSAYDLIMQSQSLENNWVWLWKLKIPPKIKSFLWLILIGKLMTNRIRHTRGYSDNPNCPSCETVEDLDHLLQLCPYATNIWKQVFDQAWYLKMCALPFDVWLTLNIKGKHSQPQLFVISLWIIWKNRNKLIFENKQPNCHVSVKLIFYYTKEVKKAFESVVTTPLQTKSSSLWLCPPVGRIKLNTDRSLKGTNNNGGFGGLFRDEKGSWISGYYGRMERCTSLEAELWAVYKGLTIILQRGMNKVIIETDAEQVVQLLNEEPGTKCPFRGIVEDSRIILRGCECTVQHVRRGGNICADNLAKLGANQPLELLIVNEPPDEIRHALVADLLYLDGSNEA